VQLIVHNIFNDSMHYGLVPYQSGLLIDVLAERGNAIGIKLIPTGSEMTTQEAIERRPAKVMAPSYY
jgi:hypothetical protein